LRCNTPPAHTLLKTDTYYTKDTIAVYVRNYNIYLLLKMGV